MTATETDSGWVGRPFKRKEDARLTTGKGKYLGDIQAAGMTHLCFHRSSHAHAKIKGIDTSRAESMPGVLAVITGEELKDEVLGFPQAVVVPALEANYPVFWPLAIDKVKFHGEPVAAVVAIDKYQAEYAAIAITVEYDPLPVTLDPENAL